ncbi:hypothetical protein [Paenibacillus prosopidis]|uniref:Uncharacterized protein n=1 Tax=Paenibacillus prosopidis TaxID=630520 RepID=A0A368VJI0_9BACL|nr:hypothetical protein [Paenibacillus prosopidis]RCW41572.1 hypothetical protein DFP97_1228 [Paenibacillus prosopidis]
MSWLGDVLFGKREKQPMLVHLSPKVIAGMETLVYLHNARTAEIDHITLDDVLEYAAGTVVRKTLKIAHREEPRQPADSPDVVDYATHRIGRGRKQLR